MEFICNLEKLKTISNNVSLAINLKQTTMPILEGILLKCENNQLKLTGYDLSLGIVKNLKVNQKQKGKIVLKAQLFVDILRKLDGELVEIKTDSNLITTIKSQSTEYKISGIKADIYPKFPEINNENKITIKDKTLKEAIFKTLFAVSINTSQNPILCGSLFTIENNILTIVSVDGYRVAISNSSIENNNINKSFVISSKTLNEILKLLKETDDAKTTIEIGETHIIFKIDEYYVISRLLQGSFLDYKAAIPKTCSTTIKIDPKILEQSLLKVSVMVTQKISVLMKIYEDSICLECESNLGKVEDILKTKIEGDILEKIAFNNKFMLDALKHCQTQNIKIGFNGPIMPIKIEPETGDEFLYLVLPVRLK